MPVQRTGTAVRLRAKAVPRSTKGRGAGTNAVLFRLANRRLAANRPSLRVPRCFLLQRRLECGSKISAAQILRSGEDFTTVAIQKQVMWNAGHANKLHQIRLASCSFVDLRPGHTLALREVNKLFLFPGAIEADAQDFKALLAELRVGRFHIGDR